MADNNAPFSVRMEQDDKEKLLQLIQESGRSNKEFMSTLLSAYELNRAKVEIPEIAKDIEGLQAVTQRINDYYVNIGKRIEDMQKSKDIEFTKETEVYKSRIETLKAENEKINNNFTGLQESYNNISNNYEDINKQLVQLHESLNDKTLLVEEYKQKNDTMTGLLNEYKQYKTEVEEYKKLLADSQSKNIELSSNVKEKDSIIEKLNNDVLAINNDKEKSLSEMNNKHIAELEAVKEKLELQKDKALLELKTQQQQQLEEVQNKHNSEIEQYQLKYKQLLEELEKSKKTSSTTHNKKAIPAQQKSDSKNTRA